jgi:SWI/SNF-related matrix-associated actin-dependent regulator of chromatin subfamily A member 5
MKEYKRINGPYLIVAPKSTLGNWMKEFKKWMPCCRVVKLIALKEERDEILSRYLQPNKFDVCLTSYEGVNICLKHLKRFNYRYIIIDEAHKIKNEEAIISQNMRRIKTNFKILLSGTPLQNTPHELWSLLNYLLPDLFDSSEVFDKWFEVNTEAKNATENKISQEELDRKNLEMV